jgi:heterokaryon incompatibility protein (HET)
MSVIVYESIGEIDVDNSILSVKYNLYDALEMLRNNVESDGPEYFWIDAICINQADMRERASQVSIMDQIYGSAEKVVVWVGQEDEFTSDAIYAISTIGNIPKERHCEIKTKDWFLQDPALARVGAQPLHWKRWLGMIAFFNRPLFQRIWIVQEVILAKRVTLICGNEQLPWQWISNTISFLIKTNWLTYVHIAYFRDNPVAMNAPGIYKKLMEDKILQLSKPLVYMEHIRTSMEQYGQPSLFRYLLATFRLSEASDPRDKIYALLSIAWKDRPPFSTHPDVLIPDYTISTKALYIKTTRVMIQSYGNLRILDHVEDESVRKMQDLPSWVPDFSVTLSAISLTNRLGRHVYKASKGLEYIADHAGYDEETLRVSGFQLSVIRDTADRFPHGVYEESPGELDGHFIKIFKFAAEISETQMKTMNSYGPLRFINTSCRAVLTMHAVQPPVLRSCGERCVEML